MSQSMSDRAIPPEATISRTVGGLALVMDAARRRRNETAGARSRLESVLTDSLGTAGAGTDVPVSSHLVSVIAESLDEAVYLFRPVFDKGRITDMILMYANAVARLQPREPLAAGLSIGEVFSDPESAVSCAENAWFERSQSECSVAGRRVIEGKEQWVPQVLRTTRVGDCILHVAIDRPTRQRRELRWLASHSPLTNLLNRSGFVRAADRLLGIGGESYCLIWIELDELDVIRQTFGFAAGDAALTVAAERLSAWARVGAVIGQPEDSALVAMFPAHDDESRWSEAAQEIVEDLARPCSAFGFSVMTGPSAGWVAGSDGGEAEMLLRQAKTASWTARRLGVSMVPWRSDLDADQAKRAALLADFGRALANDELFLEFQPKFEANSSRFIGAEALVRWMHPGKGRIMPNEFIPAVEFSGFCRPFTLWVARAALARWHDVTAVCADAKVAINVPVALLSDPEFVEALLEEIRESRIAASLVQVEITERGIDGNIAQLKTGLARLATSGISVALDDFGTGQSSLAFLRRLPIQEVKIDRSFIENLDVDQANQAVVAACVAIARTGSQIVCAEGVETEDELNMAVQLGCDAVQGFLTGRPMGIEDLLTVVGAGIL